MPGPPVELIHNVPFFSGLSDEEASELAEQFVRHDYRPGDAILIEGQQGYAFFVVESGEAAVNEHGAETATMGPGTPFGELALFDREARRSATVVAKTDMVCWSLPIYLFRPFVEGRPAVAWKLLEHLAVKLRALHD